MAANKEITVSTSARRDIINGIRVVIAVACLVATISVAHTLLGLSDWVAIVAGAVSGYMLARLISRLILPQVEDISDAELLQRKVAPRWLILAATMLLIFHLFTGLDWIISGGLSIAVGALGLTVDWWSQRQAEMRRDGGTGRPAA
jgi:hypothetical protein